MAVVRIRMLDGLRPALTHDRRDLLFHPHLKSPENGVSVQNCSLWD
jgi:hypothetical protein